MSFSNSDRYYRDRMSSSCSLKSEDSDFDMDDGGSFTNSSSGFSRMNSTYSSSTYSLNDKRRSRNQNEKKRRDQFNMLIQELGNLLNHPRKIDKATVLNETLFFFRNYNEKPLYNKEIDFKYKPFFLQNDEFMRFMIEFQNAFCLVFDLNGEIKYVSDDIIHLMGHFPKNLQNCSIYDFIDEKTSKKLKNYLKRKFNPLDSISFDCKFKKINENSSSYEPLRIKGFFKRTPNSVDSLGHFNTLAKIDSFMSINELYPRDNNKREFRTEFSMDLKYTSLDSKATEMIGYSTIEIIGTCGYDYCHLDDLEKLIDCHKKLLQNGAVPLIAYRFRTKGLQWLWIQSRFQILYHQTAMKPYAIVANNQVISLNEMVESKDLLDVNSFNSTEPSFSKYSELIAETKQEETKNNQWSTQIPSLNENFIDSKQTEESNVNKIQPPRAEKHIDDSLGSIVLRSYNDIDYRNYVLNQFKLKKQKIENTIRKQQEELKILEETMENIKDEKKLASWVMEFQRQEYSSNLYKNNQNFENKPQQKSEILHQSTIQNNDLHNVQTQQQSNYQMAKNQQMQQMRQHQSYGQNDQLTIQTNNLQQDNQLNYQNTNKNNSLLMPKNLQNDRNYIKSEIKEDLIMNKAMKRGYSPGNSTSRNYELSEEAELVGELINIRKTLPKTSNENKIDNQKNLNNSLRNIDLLRPKNVASNSSLQSIDMDDYNPEMIDKLFNYNFDSYPSQ